jgi:hypothetical protein
MRDYVLQVPMADVPNQVPILCNRPIGSIEGLGNVVETFRSLRKERWR